jgi:hypothetical protein
MRCPFCRDYLIEPGRYSVILSDICATQGYNKAYICRPCYKKYLKYIKEVNTNDNN